jgi:hypothetical protein
LQFNKNIKGQKLPKEEILNISFNQAVETERQLSIAQNSGERKNRYALGYGIKPRSKHIQKRYNSNQSDAANSGLGSRG